MSSKKEEERNEKIIRGLMKLPPNRRCINCNSPGPQYVCTNFWTFVCLSCSGIHREFTHRVKSVSMAKFTKQEVEALQQGGNQRAREIYLKNWDITRMRLPDSRNPDKIRDFIRSVYVNKKYAGERSSEKPLGDMESLKNNESYLTRPNSYHSFSQSPPYDNQYEERRYGKNTLAPRRLASERGYEGKIPSFLFSPGRLRENFIYEDQFANESSGSRHSDFSVSSAGDQFRYDAQSPNSQVGYPSPNVPYQSNCQPDAGPQRTASSSSFASFDSNSIPESTPEQLTSGSQQLAASSTQLSPLGSKQVGTRPAVVRPSASFNQRPTQQPTASIPSDTSVDLFAGFNKQNKTALNRTVSDGVVVAFNTPTEVVPTSTSVDLFAGFNNQPPVEVKNEGWANFDFSQQKQVAVANTSVQSSPVLTSTGHDLARGIHPGIGQIPVSSANAPPQVPQTVAKAPPVNHESSQPWNAFGESSGGGIHATNTQVQIPLPHPPLPGLTQVAPGHSAQFSSLAPVSTNEVAKLSTAPAVQLPVQNPMFPLPAQSQPVNNWFASARDVNVPYQGIAQDSIKSDIHSVTAVNSTGPSNLTGQIPDSLQPLQDLEAATPSLTNVPIPTNVMGTMSLPLQQLQGTPYQAMKSTNPFDFPDDSDLHNSTFMDMSSIQTALPAPQVAVDYFSNGPNDAFGSQFYTQNPASSYAPSMPQGGVQHMRDQAPNPQIANPSPQGYPSLGSNPFA